MRDGLFQIDDEDLAVTDLAGVGCLVIASMTRSSWSSAMATSISPGQEINHVPRRRDTARCGFSDDRSL